MAARTSPSVVLTLLCRELVLLSEIGPSFLCQVPSGREQIVVMHRTTFQGFENPGEVERGVNIKKR
jgi:hypothetical protein